jgi:SNF2 family DNA or RNA helicase
MPLNPDSIPTRRKKTSRPQSDAPRERIIQAKRKPSTKQLNRAFELFVEEWRAGESFSAQERYLMGRLALDRRDFSLARDLFGSLLENPPDDVHGREAREVMNDIKQCWLYADIMVTTLEPALKQCARSRKKPAARSVEQPEPVAAPAAQAQAPKPETKSPFHVEIPRVRVSLETNSSPVIEAIHRNHRADAQAFDLALQAYRHSFRVSYDQLICLPSLVNVRSLWYQAETARKVMKDFRGRAILADEVGLGKTIEAGLILKEYMARGLVKSALVLAPSSLVNQWQEELRDKFDLEFITSHDGLFRQDSAQFWAQPFIVASLHTARTDRHFKAVTARAYDLVIVDEAHHLKNQATKTWKLVNAVQKTFLLLLTATPVQNKLEEIYNLVTILKPGHLKTRTAFKDEFVTRGNPTDPRNRERLRTLLKEVMIRNTRSVTRVNLPPRFVYTTRVSPSAAESEFYLGVSQFVSDAMRERVPGINAMISRRLLEAAGSSHQAAVATLEKLSADPAAGAMQAVAGLVRLGRSIDRGTKAQRIVELLKASPDQKIVFVNYRATLEHLQRVFTKSGIRHVTFHGSMTAAQKKTAIEDFRSGCTVLLSSGTGGEGHNLQFCHMMVNYDLPWNPMEIEQRIGRIHRIGQEKEVQVYNFCAKESVEDHILEVLDRKINMFELVVGEIDMILGRLQDDKEFADMVFEIWTGCSDEQARRHGFDELASRLKRARRAHEKTKELDENLFREDFGL